MSQFYICSENLSILGQMDTSVNLQRDASSPNGISKSRTDKPRHEKPRLETTSIEKPLRWESLDHDEKRRSGQGHQEKRSLPAFHHSVQDSSEESHRPHKSYLDSSPTSPYQLGRDIPSDEALNKMRSANNITISPELFEKMYLNPQHAVKGDLQSKFGNPTPLALLGFLLSLSPLSCELMGWRGAGGDGIATVGAYYFIGGFLMSLGGILEFFLGNTFSFVVFCSFGKFFRW